MGWINLGGKNKSRGEDVEGDDVQPAPARIEDPPPALDDIVPMVGTREAPPAVAPESVNVAPPSFLPPSAASASDSTPAPEIPDISEPLLPVEPLGDFEPVVVADQGNPFDTPAPEAAVPAATESAASVAPLVPEPAAGQFAPMPAVDAPAVELPAQQPSNEKFEPETVVDVPDAPVSEAPVEAPATTGEFAGAAEIAALTASVAELAEVMAGFEQRLETAIRGNEWGRSALNKLVDEMDGYRKNFLAEAQLPLLKRLCSYHGSVVKVGEGASITPDNVEFLAKQVLDILADYGIEPLNDPIGEQLTGKRHRGLKAIPTNDPGLDGTIAETVTMGWQSPDRVVTPQVVCVYKYEPASVVASAVSDETAADEEGSSVDDQRTVEAPTEVADEGTAVAERGDGVSSEDEGDSNE